MLADTVGLWLAGCEAASLETVLEPSISEVVPLAFVLADEFS